MYSLMRSDLIVAERRADIEQALSHPGAPRIAALRYERRQFRRSRRERIMAALTRRMTLPTVPPERVDSAIARSAQ